MHFKNFCKSESLQIQKYFLAKIVTVPADGEMRDGRDGSWRHREDGGPGQQHLPSQLLPQSACS